MNSEVCHKRFQTFCVQIGESVDGNVPYLETNVMAPLASVPSAALNLIQLGYISIVSLMLF